MKITYILTALFATATLATSCGGNKEEKVAESEAPVVETVEATLTESKIDATASKTFWKGQIIGGYSHEGTINFTEGLVKLNGDKLAGGSFTIDMATITPTDENYSEEHSAEMLVGHLSTADFFDVENNPTASYEISTVEGNVATGTLTIRGKSNEEKFENIVIENGTIKGTLTFDRQKYDVAYESTMKDMVLSDDIELNIELAIAQ